MKILKRILFYLILAAIWELIYKVNVEYLEIWKAYSFPSPIDVTKTLLNLIGDNTLGIAILASLKRVIIGYIISIVIGLILGITIVKFRYIDENLTPLILGLQTLPSICWLPFAILWYGLNESSIIFVIVIGSVFSIAIAVESSIKNINPIYIKAAKTLGAKGRRIYIDVIIPASLPEIVSGMKQGWSFAWRALMAGEMLSATTGLGQILMMGRDLSDISQVVAIMLVIIVLGLIVEKLLFGQLEKNIRNRWGIGIESNRT
jgi:NitT/TauT family transport system permease protein